MSQTAYLQHSDLGLSDLQTWEINAACTTQPLVYVITAERSKAAPQGNMAKMMHLEM